MVMRVMVTSTITDALNNQWNEDQQQQEYDNEIDSIALQKALETSAI
jgi:hypothetical protein